MTRLLEQLLGRPFMAAVGEGGGNADGAKADAGASGGGDGGTSNSGSDAAGADGAKAGPTAAEIAARAGGAFNAKPTAKAGNGAADDGVDDKTRPKNDAAAGERPAHIPEKFWDAKTKTAKVDDLAKAYATLEGEFGTLKNSKGMGKAGDSADAYLPEGIKFVDDKRPDRIGDIDAKTDPALGAFRKVAHKHKLPLDVAGALAADFLAELSPFMEAPKTEADIVAELGEGGAELRDALGTWMGGLFDSKTFSETELEWAYSNFGKDATGVRVLAKVRELMGERPIPLSPGKVAGDIPSTEEWYAANRDPRMKTDPAFREKVEAQGLQIFGDAPAGTSEAGVGVPPPREVNRRERAATHR